MITTNLWRRLKDLLPEPPLLIGTVTAVADFDVVIALPDGSQARARGATTVGQIVFFRNGVIEGPAPTLPIELIEI